MKTVAIFKEDTPVTIQRFEGELQVGERKVYMADFIGSLTNELPLGSLVERIVERKSELEKYLNNVVDDRDDAISDLFTHLLKNVKVDWYKDNVYLQRLAFSALPKLSLADPNDEHVIELILNMVKNTDNLTINSHFGDLTLALVKKFLMDNSSELDIVDARKKLSKAILSILVQDEPQIKTIFKNLVPYFDKGWLIDTLTEAVTAQSQNSNKVLAEVSIPKGCVLMQVGTEFSTYVLEVPKAQFRVKYFDTAYEDVGHPRMLCVVKVKGERILDMALCAIPENIEISSTMVIYKYPYSNVFDSGKVCWTGYKDPGMIRNLSQLANIFLSTTNNSHLKSNVRELFEENSGKVFDDTILEPFKSKDGVATLQQLL